MNSARLLLLKPRDAAKLLQVSAGYLRSSNCPKVLLPGNGRTAKPLVRYRLDQLEQWVAERDVRATLYNRST